jgi:Cu/Zn superoxide dismutase
MQSDSRGDTLRRITKAALGGLAGCALILGATQAASGESPKIVYEWSGQLSDLKPNVSGGPLDGASASVRIVESPDEGIAFKLSVTDINLLAAKEEFGAHLHVGRCTERVLSQDEQGDTVVSADTTGPHYKSDGLRASPANEVWFNLLPENQDKRKAQDETWVSFEIKDTTSPQDEMSIVLHALPTDPDTPNGFAGDREACLPVAVPHWAN